MGYQLAKDEPMRFTRSGGELSTICDADGREAPATALPGAAATFAAGARAGDVAVLATAAGFVAFRRR